MATKSALIANIWNEIVALQDDYESPRGIGIPSMIPSGDGKSMVISDQMERDIHAFSRLVHDSSPDLKIAYGSEAIADLARRAFGETLATIDTETPAEQAYEALLKGVNCIFNEEFGKARPARTYVFGCWLIRDEVAADLCFGPVRFERRNLWLDRAHVEGHISAVVYRRIKRRWEGKSLRPLKDPNVRWREDALLKALGDCPVVCTVSTNGLAADVAYDKAVLATRLSMAAVALLWERPSAALEGFGLYIEEPARHRHYIVFGKPGAMGSYTGKSKPVGSTWIVPNDWPDMWENSGWIREPLTELLTSFLDPSRPATRPNVTRPVHLALWWLYEACRAQSPLMAAAKFGACLDVLASGNILRLLEARLGSRADDPVTRDGRTARSVVNSIYGWARSSTLHGNNNRYDHDWRATRDLADHLVRLCFTEVLSWLEDHPEADDLSGALKLDDEI